MMKNIELNLEDLKSRIRSFLFIGIDLPGGMQSSWTVPAYTLHALPESLSLEQGAMIEPAAVACRPGTPTQVDFLHATAVANTLVAPPSWGVLVNFLAIARNLHTGTTAPLNH